MKLKDELLRISDCFEKCQIEYALCGGLAVVVHGYPRFTKDIDLLIREQDLDRARRELSKVEYDLEDGFFCFDSGTSKERRLFRVSRAVGSELITLDLMLVSPVYEAVWNNREAVELEGRKLKIVSRDGLILMKQIAGRNQDIADIENLCQADET